MRTVDLARAAGVSTQQVRNYEDAGVLPPVPRTGSGYRTFEEIHLHAVLAYRALAAGHGPEAARRIMHAVLAGDVPAALALVDAGHAALHQERAALRTTAAALEAVAGGGVAGPDVTGSVAGGPELSVGELAAEIGVRPSALRVWEAAGLLSPRRERVTGYRRYGPAEVRDARVIRMLRQSWYPLPQIAPVLDGLRRTGSSDALREAVARRGSELTRRSAALLEGAARLSGYLTAWLPAG
ncbi:MerR family transcriptional regulator [Phytohabitans houttuyneae]|uniref:MerR family transcriptional regulator n=1 Tax=Phytohabitans houttuyneae TaxID=1076126 RepID=A0A6V8KCW8_9ACTN|nr:MerR family transcriptional regulator [Phytohabitans houttuyneae]GFJ83073.1 MerR family transcriptional regulator [Phytohabitans houttuyneae]